MTYPFIVHIRDARKNRTLCKQRASLACGRLEQVTCPHCLKRRASQIIYFSQKGVAA